MRKNKLIFVILFTFILSSCSSSYTNTDSSNQEGIEESASGVAPEDSYDDVSGEAGNLNNTSEQEAKLEKNGYINNGSYDFDEDIKNIEAIAESYNGYFQESSFTKYKLRNFNATIKVPVENFQDLFNDLKECGVNYSNSSDTVNRTDGYYSLKSQLEVKKLSMDRLENLISEAKEPQELLDLYDSYFDLVTEIEIMENDLKDLDNRTTYSTINMELKEIVGVQVVDVPKEGFMKKVAIGVNSSVNNTIDFIKGTLLVLASISIPLVLIIVLFIALGPLVKRKYKKNKENNNSKNKEKRKNKLIKKIKKDVVNSEEDKEDE